MPFVSLRPSQGGCAFTATYPASIALGYDNRLQLDTYDEQRLEFLRPRVLPS